jgi:D-alanine-D-alanine ligase
MKIVFQERGLRIADWRVVWRREWQRDRDAVLAAVESAIAYPLFVKPANLGSSVGISKAGCRQELAAAIDRAAEFDRKLLVEEAVKEAREIECAVLGNYDPEASVPGEVIPSREFYDYEAKYIDETSRLEIPAKLTDRQTEDVRRQAVMAFRAIDGCGFARVDFLMNRASGRLYVNEINTIPGFTTISMFAKLWTASGVNYPTMIDRVIKLAFERHAEKQENKTSAF